MNDTPNSTQAEYWNQTMGPLWVQLHEQLDRMNEPLGLEAMRALGPASGERILDIGCGCGHTSLELAKRVGASGAVTGVDISEPMLAVARGRSIPAGAAKPDFRLVDVQTGELGPARFDAAFSRHGVMFFADPVAAFANIRTALKPGGRLAFVCWRGLDVNLWMRAPLQAAAPLLPPMASTDPTAPGPFAFADPGRPRQVLGEAGFSDAKVDPFDCEIGRAGLEETVHLMLRIGPLAAALRENPGARDKAEVAVRDVLAAYVTPRGVMMPAAVWIVSARS
ncbi:MAG TPA: class I SAM-dependent methyltransferase [Caulobacteraceae bacterium]